MTILVATVVAVARGGRDYLPVHVSNPGAVTTGLSAVLQGAVWLGSSVCLGRWVQVAFLRPRRGARRRAIGVHGELVPAVRAGLVWAVGATALIWVDAADAAGQPVSSLNTSGAWWFLLHANYLPRAWIVSAACAWAIVVISVLATRWDTVVGTLLLGLVGVLSPVVVTQVLVGPNHDYGGDAAIIGTPAFVLLVGIAVARACWPTMSAGDPIEERRARHTTIALAATSVLADVVVCWFEMAGHVPWSEPTGRLLIGKNVCVLAIALANARSSDRRRTPYLTAGAAIAAVTCTAISFRIPPPHYFLPTTIAQNFFGFSVTAAPTFERLLTAWRVNILFAVLSAVAVAVYVAAFVRLRRRGDRWPAGRLVAWVCGWLVIFGCTSSGLGRYAGASFSIHMAFHMGTNMLGPLLLVMGGAVTLFLRATTPHRRDDAAGPHEWIAAVTQSCFARWIYHPAEVFVVMVGSYYVLYFTPLFEDSLRFHWAHQLAYLHFVIAGYLFYGLAIGVDRLPRELPYLGRLAMILAAMPFHAFFGVLVMTRDGVIAKTFYEYVGAPWMKNLAHDQYVGGGIAWAAGEFPLIIVVLALVIQWARQDSTESKRFDRQTDRGLDDSFDAYNDLLASLATRSERNEQ
ncbi:cytochrome c oxidase assembly protein [Flexivirga caeni]|uniref:Cytochrome c oxidase assembly protein n=1 Tax=Flexivirga caeni TaxID=2294115 RepID=A0A3M9M724_9MICO|nr:cytochrome c oxidase assembly protein [Flexivirga caeni]